MKNFRHIFLLFALPILILGCDSNDDGFYNTVYIDVPDLIETETLESYTVGDVLYVNSEIPRLVTEEGESTPLDIRKTTGNASSFEFTYLLEKRNGDNWEIVNVTGNFIEEQGNAETGSFVIANPEFDAVQDAYVFRGGIELVSAGEYRLNYGINSTDPDEIDLISNSSNNNITVQIKTTSNNLGNDGYYTFTVN